MASAKQEVWKEIRLGAKKQKTHYGISSLGRVCSFRESLEDKKILKGTIVNGYAALKLKIEKKDYQFYIHKLVAQYFAKKGAASRIYVIHLDFNKLNNNSKNLRWASKAEMEKHQQNSPNVKSYRAKTRLKGHKLTAGKVKLIKQKIFDKNRRSLMRDIAHQFGISEMQLYRIKSGENWGHI